MSKAAAVFFSCQDCGSENVVVELILSDFWLFFLKFFCNLFLIFFFKKRLTKQQSWSAAVVSSLSHPCSSCRFCHGRFSFMNPAQFDRSLNKASTRTQPALFLFSFSFSFFLLLKCLEGFPVYSTALTLKVLFFFSVDTMLQRMHPREMESRQTSTAPPLLPDHPQVRRNLFLRILKRRCQFPKMSARYEIAHTFPLRMSFDTGDVWK